MPNEAAAPHSSAKNGVSLTGSISFQFFAFIALLLMIVLLVCMALMQRYANKKAVVK